MVFPQVQSITTTAFSTDTTSHLVAMPGTVVADDLLLMFICSAHASSHTHTTPTGWTQLFSLSANTLLTFSAYSSRGS